MLAIVGGKGGCGKTTSALGLAAALEEPALVADCDVDMPNTHAMAAVSREPTLAELTEPGVTPAAVASDPVDEWGTSVVPAPPAAAESRLGPALDRLARAARPVLLDCPAGAGPDAATPLSAADAAVVVSTLCAPALRDAAKTVAMARAIGTPVVGTVLTRTRLEPDAVSDLLDCPVLASVPAVEPPVLDRRVVRAAYDRAADRLPVGKH
jgi:septum site-determining protein MinD